MSYNNVELIINSFNKYIDCLKQFFILILHLTLNKYNREKNIKNC